MPPLDNDTFLTSQNGAFIAELYGRYLVDPKSVDPSWQGFFAELGDEPKAFLKEMEGPGWGAKRVSMLGNGHLVAPTTVPAAVAALPADVHQAALDSIRAMNLIRSYRVRGHLIAELDPLGLERRTDHPDLDPATFGFIEADYDRPIFVNNLLGFSVATIREILAALRATYCGHVGIEYMHIQELEQRQWIQARIEVPRNQTDFTERGKRAIYERLVEAEFLERFLDRRYTGTKRFGLEGSEALIPALEQVLKRGGQLGMKELVIGMPHRGRLNVLTNMMGKPYAALFSEFQGNSANPEDVQGSGDVKYHLGTSSDRDFDGTVVHLSLTANPSHLEAVNPVTLGKVRAKQRQRGDRAHEEVVGLLMHGDAAFAGQGLVAETLELSELKGYRSGGTIHFIVNNQIGFTTSPAHARSGPYPSDVAKTIQAPIFHVNGDDPEAVVHVARIATEFRHHFRKDVVVDIFCYRRHGHNETDEPAFTQPLMYKAIAAHPTTREIYRQRLIEEGLLKAEDADAIERAFLARLETEFEAAKSYRPNKADWLEGEWRGFTVATSDDRRGKTAAELALLKEVGAALTRAPEGFNLNRKIARQLQAKREALERGEGIDWATAEALAFGTLLAEGTFVRLSGQDSGRGTFSQRHAVLYDQESEERHIPLNHIRDGQAQFEVIDSPLSEAAVLGFEYGYSLADPRSLVLWEAQFGDFANGAQVIIDQFIASGEAKWLRMSGVVLLLPHGYEGQGPEHSSARLERFLQLCGEDNVQVCNLTSAANYFHVLRRQVRRNFRKPLVVMTPKSLLRNPEVAARLAEMGPGTSFHRVFGEIDTLAPDPQVRRVLLCSGKVYFDLLHARRERKIADIAILRVEQLYPFPAKPLAELVVRYPNAEFVWVQEEPENMGAWSFADRRIEKTLSALDFKAKRARYVGRPEAAAAATGLLKRHTIEQARLVDEALAS
ncbi:MAG: 2-oxoglutarate dehydrogenase E1 component [Alphaproteobacteria bacterium]|nr:2-oxoglutarate dehydrogenase E1 component [Alphaproteobacteria bacterium]